MKPKTLVGYRYGLILLALLLMACASNRAVEPEPQTDYVLFRTIARHYSCGWTDHAAVVVRDDKQLKWMWDRFYANVVNPKPLPEIDFGKVMWICVFRGRYSTWGYTTEIQKIEQTSDAHSTFIRVHILETNPNRWMYVKQEFSQPFHIVELAKSDRPIHFTYKERRRWW